MIVETAPAKINLALHIRARRSDGYHELETLFAFLADGDTVTLEDGPPGLVIEGPFAGGLDSGADNLVVRAAALFAETFGVPDRAALTLVKRLPIASGIGGGSADAAATLRALARRHGIARDDRRLFDAALALGSDVPACLLGRTALGRGRGEVLTPSDGLAGTPVLLVNPGVAVSTASVFRAWSGADAGPIPPGDPLAAALAGRNDLEPPARLLAPEIDAVLAELTGMAGARLVRMSGSGATCFALFDGVAARDAARASIASCRPEWWCLSSVLT
ncbi:4-(cytidine 5'-diphospho)-2-C-methyl-D-erythritol kinase [Sphingomonas aracearum]|uniref:4-diphosphocytidyl-2-C-methyl-D-erythritol kinase n=1 Tax=Sphingomonas aracearum TaxID=2283317 RepID=A0A369W3G0_9SPHN|nr:4-(cytidine 5'-diphospho)-2-C-methyl-D-erythritol kinase [Sphingomonas aracearum]RDE06601.1 4-(cytidine 5'-diphospho)-2-C-methyl-D-erythritol kinase [Sphingomonas aracearum]